MVALIQCSVYNTLSVAQYYQLFIVFLLIFIITTLALFLVRDIFIYKVQTLEMVILQHSTDARRTFGLWLTLFFVVCPCFFYRVHSHCRSVDVKRYPYRDTRLLWPYGSSLAQIKKKIKTFCKYRVSVKS